MNKRKHYWAGLLIAAVALTACSGSNEITEQELPQEQQPVNTVSRTWNVSGTAVMTDADGTRAISIGGNNGKTLFANWQDNDVVEAYDSNGNKVGTLYATADASNTIKARLHGTITGVFNVGDQLTYYTRSKAYDYNEQKGTIADISANRAYMKATATVESAIDGSGEAYLTMSETTFAYEEAIVKLVLKVGALTEKLPVEELTISANGLVQSIAEDGTVTYGDVTVRPDVDPTYNEKPNEVYVALRNDLPGSQRYTFYLRSGDDFYEGFGSKELAYGEDGKGYYILAPRMFIPVRAVQPWHLGRPITQDGYILYNKAHVDAANKTAIAVIFDVGDKGDDAMSGELSEYNHGLAAALAHYQNVRFSPHCTPADDLEYSSFTESPIDYWHDDMAGWDHTNKIIAANPDAPEGECAAVMTKNYKEVLKMVGNTFVYTVPDISGFPNSGWFLPSIGQWRLLLENLGEITLPRNGERVKEWRVDTQPIQARINSSGYGVVQEGRHYWTSSEYGKERDGYTGIIPFGYSCLFISSGNSKRIALSNYQKFQMDYAKAIFAF